MKAEAKQNEKKNLGFLGSGLHTHEQARVCIIKPVYVGSCVETLKTQKQGRTLKHKF